MKTDRETRTALAEPDEALLGYLQTLLDEIPDDPAPAPAPAPVKPAIQPPVAVQAAPEPTVVEAVPEPEVHAPQVEAPEPVEPALPAWAREPFQALNFEAAGARFSLPLLDMKSIVPLSGSLTQLPGSPGWHLGVLSVRGENVTVVDLSWLLRGQSTEVKGAYVLLLGGGRWGLACQSLGNAFRVEPNDVRWRRGSAGPRYLQGVLRESMTPLLSSREILERLESTGS